MTRKALRRALGTGWRSTLAVCLLTQVDARPAGAQGAFYRADTALSFTLRTDFKALGRDRDTTDAPWRPATIAWTDTSGPRSTSVRVRTRGAFRLRLCDIPPIRLRFTNDSVRGTPWHDLHRPKLGVYCKDRDDFEQNVLHEYTLYRVYALLTPLAYRSRLVRVTYEDVNNEVRPVTRYGFITEDPGDFVERVHGEPLERQGIRQNQVASSNAALLGVWQYFIANTDWSVPGLHNVTLLRVDSVVRAVPFDFDWAGAIDARYARPDPRLAISSVRQRVYRGQCLTAEQLEPVLARFEAVKDSIAALYRSVPGLDPRIVERTMTWYGEFYREIADRRRFIQRVVTPTCFQ